ncbi:MAG: hypothetical protein H7144_02880 [Burkholderiales bacterium]|nr:hypothetical protein [Phycisphaerae bacterium]
MDDELLSRVDALVAEKRTTRSALTETALLAALRKAESDKLDAQIIQAYRKKPLTPDELGWEPEQVWPEWKEKPCTEAKSAGTGSKRQTRKGQSSSSRAKK